MRGTPDDVYRLENGQRLLTQGMVLKGAFFHKPEGGGPAGEPFPRPPLSVLLRGGVSGERIRKKAHRALDKILNNRSPSGVVETYFDPTGERAGIVDAVVCCNVLFLAHQLNRGPEARATIEHVRRVLVEESFLAGTRYYHSPDTFLFFLGRLVHCFPAETEEMFLEPLKAAIKSPQTAHMAGETSIERDGTIDNMIVAHEFGHYLDRKSVV